MGPDPQAQLTTLQRRYPRSESCRLCLSGGELQNSHIFPELLFRPLYDTKGRALAIHPDERGVRYEQKGWRECLLCKACEQEMGHRERFFSQLWYHPPLVPLKPSDEFLQLEGLDYSQLKLFLLSLLWRASVSRREEFSQTDLGPHEERAREMLRATDPGKPSEFRIFAAVLTNPKTGRVAHDIIIPPTRTRLFNRRVYVAAFGGCAWHFVVTRQPIEQIANICLSEHGRLLMWIRPFTEFPVFHNYMRKHAKRRQ